MIIDKRNYIHKKSYHNKTAAEIILPYLFEYYKPNSIVDVGCGLGSWLAVAKTMGVDDIVGVESLNARIDELFIDPLVIVRKNLDEKLVLNRTFDLALCLEVAEHLNKSSADAIVSSLVSLAPAIVFSAAVPGQGGQNHLNEQWPEYWQEKFKTHGYSAFDIFRNKFWNDDNVDPWYRQNMVLYLRNSLTVNKLEPLAERLPALLHPDIFSRIIIEARKNDDFRRTTLFNPPVAFSFKIFIKSILIFLGLKKKVI